MEVCGGDTRMATGGCDKGDVTVDENGVYLFNDATKVGDAAKVHNGVCSCYNGLYIY